MKSSRFAFAIVLSSSVSLFACDHAGSGSAAGSSSAAASPLAVRDQCAALDKANEQWSDKITKRKDTKDAAKDNQAMAKDVDAWSNALGKLPIDDATLKDLLTSEQSALKDESSTLKELTGLMLKLDNPTTVADQKTVDDIQKQMDAIDKKIDGVQAKSDAIDKKIEDYCADK